MIDSVSDYKNLLTQISERFEEGQSNAVQAINRVLVETYWQIGKHIVEFEQKGNAKASYGKGLSLSNLNRMRQFIFFIQKLCKSTKNLYPK
jgi:hypothetical protein